MTEFSFLTILGRVDGGQEDAPLVTSPRSFGGHHYHINGIPLGKSYLIESLIEVFQLKQINK